jgi:hypothetical protein
MKLFVHIGQGKTGSSAIQAFLNINRKKLADDFGILYPDFSGTDLSIGDLHNHGIFINKAKEDPNYCISEFKRCMAYCKEKHIEKIILSAENWHNPIWRETLSQITEACQIRPKIILYLRRQDYWIESAWKQWGAKNEKFRSIKEYAGNKSLDWLGVIQLWLEHFEKSDFIIHTFEKEMIGDDVVSDFLKIFQINDKNLFLLPKENNFTSNPGFVPEVVEIMNQSKSIFDHIHDNRLLDLLFEYLPSKYHKKNPFASYGFLSPKERIEILNQYEESNKRIAELFFNDGRKTLFLEPAPEPDEPWSPPDELTLNRLTPVLMELFLSQKKKTDDLIRKIQVLRSNLNQSNNLNPEFSGCLYIYPINYLFKKIQYNSEVNQLSLMNGEIHFFSNGTDPQLFIPEWDFRFPTLTLIIEITVPGSTILQCYYKSNRYHNYHEKRTSNAILKAGRNRIIINLQDTPVKGQIRIDPGKIAGNYILHSLEIHP